MNWHDLVFACGGITLLPALALMVRDEQKPPVTTSLLTGLVMSAFTVDYLGLGLWSAATVSALSALLWFTLAVQRLKGDRACGLPGSRTGE